MLLQYLFVLHNSYIANIVSEKLDQMVFTPNTDVWASGSDLLTLFLCVHGAVSAIEELPFKKLNGNHSKYEHEELVNNEDVKDVLQGCNYTVKNSLQGWKKVLAEMFVRKTCYKLQTSAIVCGFSEVYLKFGESFDGFKRTQDSEDSEGLYRLNVSSFVVSGVITEQKLGTCL